MQPFIISLNGLAQGKTEFCWRVEGQFFSSFENSEILDADLQVEVDVVKSGRYIGLDIDIQGEVVVECDRCLADLTLPVDTHKSFSVKFGAEEAAGTSEVEGEREILYLPEDNTEMDLAQVIYDYSCLSLPLCRVHEDGECDPETVKYLSSEDDADEAVEAEAPASDNPFAALKNLFEDK